jgi:hypothetical protein
MKKSELKQLIKEVINETNSQRLTTDMKGDLDWYVNQGKKLTAKDKNLQSSISELINNAFVAGYHHGGQKMLMMVDKKITSGEIPMPRIRDVGLN